MNETLFARLRMAYLRGAAWRDENGSLDLVEKASYDYADKETSPPIENYREPGEFGEGATVRRAEAQTVSWPVSVIEGIEAALNEAPICEYPDFTDAIREVLALARQAEALQRENAELRKRLDACDWYWPEDDTSSDACADGPWQIAENCDLPPGEVLAYSRGGVVETRFYAYLPPADDSDSDDDFEVDAETESAVKQAIEAETARRARALIGGGGSHE